MNVQLCGWKKRGKKVLFISSRGAVRLMWQLNKIEDDAVLQVHFWHNSQQFPVEHKSITVRSSIKLCRLPYDVWCIMSMCVDDAIKPSRHQAGPENIFNHLIGKQFDIITIIFIRHYQHCSFHHHDPDGDAFDIYLNFFIDFSARRNNFVIRSLF